MCPSHGLLEVCGLGGLPRGGGRDGHGPVASTGSSLNPLAIGSGEPSGKHHAHDRNYFDCNFWGHRIQICLASFPSVMSLSSSIASLMYCLVLLLLGICLNHCF